MTKQRRRQLKLIGDVLFNLLAIAFGGVGLVILFHSATTPALRNQPFDSTLEPLIGHTATLGCFTAFCLFIVVSAVLFLLRAIRQLRRKTYLRDDDPPFADFM